MGRVDGKVALITGAARGQGRSHALRLAAEGAAIIAIDLCEDIETNGYPLARIEDLEETVRQVKDLGVPAVCYKADVRDPSHLREVVSAGVSDLGSLHVVVANAGISPLGGEVPVRVFQDVIEVDFVGVVHTVSSALAYLGEGASIICTGSLAAYVDGFTDNPELGPGGLGYTMAKRWVAEYVHYLALTLASRKIRVNALHPSNCNTDMLHSEPMYRIFRPDLENPTREDAMETFPSVTAMGVPWVEPEDVSAAVLFLASDESRYVTGMQLRIDAGGYLNSVSYHR